MRYVYDDGGRAAAGFKGEAGDCGCRAITIATQRPYKDVYDDLNRFAKAFESRKRGRLGMAYATGRGSSARTGYHKETMRAYMESIGWTWVPTMAPGTGCKVHLNPAELPYGPIVCVVSRHYVAVVNGTIRDTYDPSRDGSRCVYGYWWKRPK